MSMHTRPHFPLAVSDAGARPPPMFLQVDAHLRPLPAGFDIIGFLTAKDFTQTWPILGPLLAAFLKPPWLFVLGMALFAAIYEGSSSYSGRQTGKIFSMLFYVMLFPFLYGMNVNAADQMLKHFNILQMHTR